MILVNVDLSDESWEVQLVGENQDGWRRVVEDGFFSANDGNWPRERCCLPRNLEPRPLLHYLIIIYPRQRTVLTCNWARVSETEREQRNINRIDYWKTVEE